MLDERMVLLQVCTDFIAADVLVGRLRAEAIPAVAHNLAPIPGLEQGTQVLVPEPYLRRARALLAQELPSEAELTELAMRDEPPK
ncbi:MAG: hypothetical protein ACREU3_09305 [Steroidobacteraceae bacterium]